MNSRDIRNSSDPDLAGSYAAMLRAARSAEDIAIKTNTSILVSMDGKDVELTAADLIKMSLPLESGSHNEMHNLVYGRCYGKDKPGAVHAGI